MQEVKDYTFMPAIVSIRVRKGQDHTIGWEKVGKRPVRLNVLFLLGGGGGGGLGVHRLSQSGSARP